MRLTEFGKKVRTLRMECEVPLKAMAEHMGISSAHLSAIEFGDKTLSENHIASAVSFFASKQFAQAELDSLQQAGDASLKTVNVESLTPDLRAKVALFARDLQLGGQQEQMMNKLKDRS